jgi:hypothetical protein
MSLPEPSRRITEAEYLEIERAAEFKSEFFDGEMFAMAGGTPLHSLIATNLARELGNRLMSSRCVVYNADLRLKIEATRLLTYPDLSVVCGPLQFAEGTDDTVTTGRWFAAQQLIQPFWLRCSRPPQRPMIAAESSSITGKFQRCRNICSSARRNRVLSSLFVKSMAAGCWRKRLASTKPCNCLP